MYDIERFNLFEGELVDTSAHYSDAKRRNRDRNSQTFKMKVFTYKKV